MGGYANIRSYTMTAVEHCIKGQSIPGPLAKKAAQAVGKGMDAAKSLWEKAFKKRVVVRRRLGLGNAACNLAIKASCSAAWKSVKGYVMAHGVPPMLIDCFKTKTKEKCAELGKKA